MPVFDFTKPNSTPQKSAGLPVSGLSVVGSVGSVTPQNTNPRLPQVAAFLTGVASNTALGVLASSPGVIQLSGVSATGYLSDSSVGGVNPSAPATLTLSGVVSLSVVTSFGGSSPAGIASILPAENLNIPALLKTLRVPGGPCLGAFYQNSAKGLVSWYAANVGLLSITQFLSSSDLDAYIRPYLDVYISRLNGNFSISDVVFNAGSSDLANIGTQTPTSDDNYAASFIRLACRYVLASQNYAWFDTNKGTLASIMDNMIYNNLGANGLVCRYALPGRTAVNQGYLQNNCEDWAALNDFAGLLIARNDNFNGTRYANLASAVSSAIFSLLWVPSGPLGAGFMSSDADAGLQRPFYPNTVSNAYPQAMGVSGLSGQYDATYAYINSNSPGWENGGYDPNPWMVLGLTAAIRGDVTRANTQTAMMEAMYTATPNSVNINELGMYQRIKSVLGGLSPT